MACAVESWVLRALAEPSPPPSPPLFPRVSLGFSPAVLCLGGSSQALNLCNISTPLGHLVTKFPRLFTIAHGGLFSVSELAQGSSTVADFQGPFQPCSLVPRCTGAGPCDSWDVHFFPFSLLVGILEVALLSGSTHHDDEGRGSVGLYLVWGG